jgi:hypothetical protein
MQKRMNQINDYFSEMWQKHKIWIILLMIATLFDTLTTIHFMTEEGIYLEIHPLVRYAALSLGPVVGTILSVFCYKTIVSIFLAIYLKRLRLWILSLPTIISILAGFCNLAKISF